MDGTDSYVQRFLLEDLDIRGAVVHLGSVWRALQERRNYSPALRSLVGGMAAVTTVVGANLKQPGRLTFQLKGHGPVTLMVIDCDQTLNLRGYAKGDPAPQSSHPRELFGDGRLLLTLDVAGLDQPYQSIVPIEGETLAEIFEAYLRQSEQQPARLWLAADAGAAACLFLQKLPGADARDADGWSRISQLAATVSEQELLALDSPVLLQRLFHEEDVRLYAPRAVRHDWPPNRDKVADMLRSLGPEQLKEMLEEHGEARVHDELSNHEYVFDADELQEMIDHPPTLQ